MALLQEAVVPDWARDRWPVVIHAPKYSGHVPWGSAIVSRHDGVTEFTPTEEHEWLRDLWGAVVIAQPRSEGDLWFASIHSNAYGIPPERLATHDLSALRKCHPTTIWEIEAIAHDLERLLAGGRFVAGGDLNSGLLFDAVNGYEFNARLFANLLEAGCHDLRRRFFEEEQQTFFKPGRRAYQLDHLYADSTTEGATKAWRVRAEVATDLLLSDHAPIEVEIESWAQAR